MSEQKQYGNLPEYLRKVLAMIPDNGRRVRVADIVKATNMTSTAVRDSVRELIFKYGYPIGTDNTKETPGYFIITTEEERAATVRNLRSRAKHILARARKIRDMDLPGSGDDGIGA